MSPNQPERAFKVWTELETDKLIFWWGTFSLTVIAKRLGRTRYAVSEKARTMKLGPFSQETVSMREFVRLSGYDDSRVFASAEALGIKLKRIEVGKPGAPRPKRAWGITPEQQEKLLAHFAEHPGIFYPNKPGSGKTTQGVWGIGRKPPACLRCQKTDDPHYSKGLCEKCYQRTLRGKKLSMTTAPIDRFIGVYRFLSNFFPATIVYEDKKYYSLEHAYQAMKTKDLEARRPLQFDSGTELSVSPAKAKSWGRKVQLRDDWENIKLTVMKDLLRLKFEIPELRARLLETGDRELIEGNNWGDRFWGKCELGGIWEGANHLGKLLMEIRTELRGKTHG